MKQRNYSKWWRLVASPANHDELPQLELPWIGPATSSSGTHGDGQKVFSGHHFSHGNQIKGRLLKKKLCSKLQTDNVFIVPRTNTGGGLALYWKNSIDLNVMSSSPTDIDAVVNPGVDDAWRFTGFYGNPVTANREHSWALLKHLCLKMDLPWMCVGDFNEIVKAEEKMGGALRRERQMREFREVLDFCGFRDLGFVGSPFTWCNNHPDEGVTWIWLDRGVATPSWSQLFPTVRVHHIAGSLSDHCPLWLSSDDENKRFYKRNRPFRFEAAWLKDERCEGVIKQAWQKQSPGEHMDKVIHKIEACRTSLQCWSRLSFGNIRQLLEKKEEAAGSSRSFINERGQP